MKIGLFDMDNTGYPNLPLMKISAYHKNKGDEVEFFMPILHYDIVYVSKVFSDEYYPYQNEIVINADKIVYGGTGFAISVVDEKEVYDKSKDNDLPHEIEHQYPDYSLYHAKTKDTAFGFLTRGCPNNCSFCIVTKKESCKSRKVADLNEFWNGQKNIKLLDANILACENRLELLEQLANSKAYVDFTQGLDARFIDKEVAEYLKKIKCKTYHFAFDFLSNEKRIIDGLKIFKDVVRPKGHKNYVYILTNYNTTFDEDIYRIKLIQKCGLDPDIRIYRKKTAPQILKYLQRWCNNRIIYRTQPDFFQYIPKKCGRTIEQLIIDGEI